MRKVVLTYLLIFAGLNMAFVMPSDLFSKKESKISEITTIHWNESDPLSWHDFKGHAKNWTGVSALTASAIEYSYDCYKNKIDIDVTAIFIKEQSWVKNDAATDYILAHEQLHFDITEIHARKLRRELSKQVKDCNDTWKIEQIASKVIKDWKKIQHNYDQDTHHSVNREAQMIWEEKVAFDLNATANYTVDNWKLHN